MVTFGIVAGVGAATVAAALLGSPVLGVLPVLAATAAWIACSAPLRWTATALLFAGLAFDDRGSAEGLWHTPLAIVGDVLHSNLDAIFPALSGVKVNGTELVLLFMVGLAVFRRARGRGSDSQHRVQTATALRDATAIYLLAIAYGVVNGLATGGNPQVALWQTRSMLLTAALFLVFQAAYRGPIDFPVIGRTVVLAAATKATLAIWIRLRVAPHIRSGMEYTTTHGDSILFATACAILIAHLAEKPDRKRLGWAMALLPLILWGMVANQRRLVWVELVLVLGLFFVASPRRPWKRFAARSALALAPVAFLYVAAGWNSSAPIFAPVQTLRSVTDSGQDRSTWDRQVESWNISMTLKEAPLRGRGFGHEYIEFIPMDDISRVFPMYKAQPHNMLLGLLLFAGAFGFVGIGSAYATSAYLSVRAIRHATRSVDRAAGLCSLAVVLVIWLQIQGDMGLFAPQARLLGAIGFVVAGKLAVATGAWPARRRRAFARVKADDQ